MKSENQAVNEPLSLLRFAHPVDESAPRRAAEMGLGRQGKPSGRGVLHKLKDEAISFAHRAQDRDVNRRVADGVGG